jgi:alpha-beta hydrolase superfamily lysophospholipase
VTLFWLGLIVMCSVPICLAVWLTVMYGYLRWKYVHLIVRIFQEKPLFIIPRGDPLAEAETVTFQTVDGLTLCGCYLATPHRRRGVILFGLEFGSSRWSCRSYCEHLVENGFDVFAFESRNQGASDSLPGYDPLPWVTHYEVEDVRAALRYLKGRPDADPRGVGFFGISKGGAAGLFAASSDPTIRCCVTDGAFATYSTLVPYMRHWFRIYNRDFFLQGLLPSWYYGLVGLAGLRQIERERHCRFPHLEKVLGRLAPRPLLMIHGELDTYIKQEMAQALFACAREPKEFWLVEGAKHNQALHMAGDEYRRRVLEFFENHLAGSMPFQGMRIEPRGSRIGEARAAAV